ncbi:MAG: hypothetical protein ACP5EK_00080 [Thermoplasmatota archaeon]
MESAEGQTTWEETPQRPAGVAVLAMLYGLWSAVLMITGGLMVLGGGFLGLPGLAVAAAGGLVFFLGLFGFLVAWGLWNRMNWARRVAIVFALLGLLAFPVGTIISLLLLWYLFKPGAKKAFG